VPRWRGLRLSKADTPQAPGRTPDKAPQAPLRCPGAEDTPPEASEAPAREADNSAEPVPAAGEPGDRGLDVGGGQRSEIRRGGGRAEVSAPQVPGGAGALEQRASEPAVAQLVDAPPVTGVLEDPLQHGERLRVERVTRLFRDHGHDLGQLARG